MVMVMIALAVTSIMALTFLSGQTTSKALAHNASRHVQARAIAEDAMELALAHVRDEAGWREGFVHGNWTSEQALHGGSFRLMVEDPADGDLSNDVSTPARLTVEAMFDGVGHRLQTQLVPRPAGLPVAVMLVTGELPPVAADLQKQALFESWGFTVAFVADDDSQAVYDETAAISDVVFVSENVSSGSVNIKLDGLQIGVVLEEPALVDELGMAAGTRSFEDTEIRVSDVGHPITAGLEPGLLQIAAESTELKSLTSPASGLRVLATGPSGSAEALALLDVGDTLKNGQPSPNRRVVSPFGTSSFQIDELNDAGRQLVRRMLEWAAARRDRPVTADGYWPLDETTGSEARDVIGQHPGTYTLSPTRGEPGLFGNAVTFTNAPDRVTLPAELVDGRDNVSYSAWIRTTRTGAQAVLSGANASENNVELIFLANHRSLRFYHRTSGYETWNIESIADDQWHHLLVVRDRDNGRVTAYRDGVSLGSIDVDLPAIRVDHLVLGEEQDRVDGGYDRNQAFVGQIDEFRFYGRALTAEEAVDVYRQGAYEVDEPRPVVRYNFEPPAAITPELWAHWKLDETSEPVGSVSAEGEVTLQDNAFIDSYLASAGAYTGPTAGTFAVVSSNLTDPGAVELRHRSRIEGDAYVGPGGDPQAAILVRDDAQITGRRGALLVDADVTAPLPPAASGNPPSYTIPAGDHTLSSNVRLHNVTLASGARVTIQGNVVIDITGNMTLDNNAHIIVPPGSTLQGYVRYRLTLNGSATINNDSAGPERVQMSAHGNREPTAKDGDIFLNGTSVISGQVFANSDVQVNNNAHFYGSLAARDDIRLYNNAAIHIDALTRGAVAQTAREEVFDQQGLFVNNPLAGLGGHGDGGGAVYFDGTDDHIVVNHHDHFELEAGTLSFWFYAEDLSGLQGLIYKDAQDRGDGGHLGVLLYGNRLVVGIESSSATYIAYDPTVLETRRWYHVAASFGPAGLRLYVDGRLRAGHATTTGLADAAAGWANTEPWTFGVAQSESQPGTASGWSYPFHGRLDDIRLYPQQLNADQSSDLAAGRDPRDVVPDLVPDVADVGAPVDLTLTQPDRVVWVEDGAGGGGGGLRIEASTRVVSDGPPDRLREALQRSETFTLEIELTPANITQGPMSRIVSWSGGGSSQDLQLMQNEKQVRSRFPAAFISSGAEPLDADDAFDVGRREHLIVTYDGEQHRMYRNGRRIAEREITGDLDNWDATHLLQLASEAGGEHPWLGTFHRMDLWNGPVNDLQALNLYNGDRPGPPTGDNVDYRLDWLESP